MLAPCFWKQVVVRNFFWITYFIFLDLVEIDALSKLIRFTEGDNWDSVLASQVSDHRCANVRYHSSISKHITNSEENFGCLSDKRAYSLNKSVLAVYSVVTQSLGYVTT